VCYQICAAKKGLRHALICAPQPWHKNLMIDRQIPAVVKIMKK
jgi:hypothetical protein